MSFQTRDHHGVVYHTSSILDAPGLIHGFSTRLGGVSEGPFASLNFRGGGPEPDVRENVRENYRRFCEALGTDVHNVVQSHQVHEDTVRHVTGADRGKGLFAATDYTADALVTDEPDLSLMVFSADCIILLLHDPVTASIGAVHAGWRGTALDLPAKTVGEMGRLFGAKPEDIRVAVGAGIGPCCFETHDDVPDAMRSAFGGGAEAHIRPKGEKWTVDLKGINAWRLREAGVRVENIDVCTACTACRTDLYWSHRITGDRRGGQGALIALPGEEGGR
ncbi:MAG: peptidoglycan editing factor PgeF [Oscillospiraceae bacterium]|nr:peptidoglycan editing factor PgeF [Oscillospiraceae bacterium]